MKMINPRSGHGSAFGIEIIYLGIAILLGWPVTIPVIFISGFLADMFNVSLQCKLFDVVGIFSIVVGTYVHYRLWKFVYTSIVTWWNS